MHAIDSDRVSLLKGNFSGSLLHNTCSAAAVNMRYGEWSTIQLEWEDKEYVRRAGGWGKAYISNTVLPTLITQQANCYQMHFALCLLLGNIYFYLQTKRKQILSSQSET